MNQMQMRRQLSGLGMLGDGPSIAPDELLYPVAPTRYYDGAGREIPNPYSYDEFGNPYLTDPNSKLFQFTSGPVNTEDIFSTGFDPWLYREIQQTHPAFQNGAGSVLMLHPNDLVSLTSEPRIVTAPSITFNAPALPPSLLPETRKTIQPDPEQVARNLAPPTQPAMPLPYASRAPAQRTPGQPGQPGGQLVQSEESGAPDASNGGAASSASGGGALLLAALAALSLFQ
jgi:hypothetical protein